MTYVAVNAVVIVLVALACALLLRRRRDRGRIVVLMAITFGVVALFTAVFDSLMIAAGLFRYEADHLVGTRIGLAPVEDFAYVVLAAVLLPSLWLARPGLRRGRH